MRIYLEKMYEHIIQYGMNLIAAVLIFVIGKWMARIISRFIEKALLKSKVNKTLTSFSKNIIYFGILIFVIIAVLNKLGIETSSFVVIVGAAGLAIGLALQGSLSNFAAGVMLVIFQPFQVDDFIEAAGAIGTVEEIQTFNTVLKSPDNKRIILPNAKITADKITVYPRAPEEG